MSTLSLEDLGANQRRRLGLAPTCSCIAHRTAAIVAQIPVVETAPLGTDEPTPTDRPGAVWLDSGLHRLRAASALPAP